MIANENAPPSTLVFRNRRGVRVFILVAVEPILRANGWPTKIGIFKSRCRNRNCRKEFFVASSISKAALRDGSGPLKTCHCVGCRRGATLQSVARDRELAAKFGGRSTFNPDANASLSLETGSA